MTRSESQAYGKWLCNHKLLYCLFDCCWSHSSLFKAKSGTGVLAPFSLRFFDMGCYFYMYCSCHTGVTFHQQGQGLIKVSHSAASLQQIQTQMVAHLSVLGIKPATLWLLLPPTHHFHLEERNSLNNIHRPWKCTHWPKELCPITHSNHPFQCIMEKVFFGHICCPVDAFMCWVRGQQFTPCFLRRSETQKHLWVPSSLH